MHQEIEKGESLVIEDFPKTEQQAYQLARLTNPELFPSESEFSKRCKELLKVVGFEAPLKVKREPKPMRLDLYIWMNIAKEQSLKRCMSRRVNSEMEVLNLFEVQYS